MNFLDKISPDEVTRLRSILDEGWNLNGFCWEWTGPKAGQYGSLEGIAVHRLAHALYKSDFKTSSFICHLCHNPICYNPAHIYEGDAKTNARDETTRGRVRSIY